MKTLLLWVALAAVASSPAGARPIFGIRLSDILRPWPREQQQQETSSSTTTPPPVPATPAGEGELTTTKPRRIIDIPQAAKCPAGQRWAGGQCRVAIGRR